jgi:hypothetical protein
VGLLAGAAALGLVATVIDASPHWLGHTARLFLVLFGAVATGAAVSMRADLWQTWALGAAGGLLAVFGTPEHWDSFRLLFGAMTAVALVWAVLLAAPSRYRLPVLSALIGFHFLGIFFATTSPPSTPWITEQAFLRVYNPYLQFVYLRNAYHFYSPEPGPASILVFLLKTQEPPYQITDPKLNALAEAKVPEAVLEKLKSIKNKDFGSKKNLLDVLDSALTSEELARYREQILTEVEKPRYTTKWVVTPKRPADVKDPLGLTYYRRLSITEQVARGTLGLTMPGNYYEKADLISRRKQVPIPLPPSDADSILQYRLPQSEVSRFVIPSYASHVIIENTANEDEARRTTVKMYRLEHGTMSVDEFINWRHTPNVDTSPYNPTTYRPYFQGEFNARGDLINPQEPMLYWLVPATPRPGGIPPGDPTKRSFLDYMSFHALGPDILGPDTTVDQLGDPKFKNYVFDWNQLR